MPWVKRLALPASASTAASLAITSSAFLARGAQVCETVAIGPDTPVVLPKLLLSPAMSESTSRSEENTSELPSLMRISYAVFCLKKKNNLTLHTHNFTPATTTHPP